MLRPEFAEPAAGNGERIAARITTQFLIRHCAYLSEAGGGDLVRGLVLAAVLDANVRYMLPYSAESRALAGIDSVPPDEARMPISVSALARSLNMPYETTRRHINKLLEEGACVRVLDEGVIVPSAWVAERKDVTEKVYGSLRTMLGMLHQAGFDLEAMARPDGAG